MFLTNSCSCGSSRAVPPFTSQTWLPGPPVTDTALFSSNPYSIASAARGVKLREVESTGEGDIDLRGILGIARDVRNGYQGIRISFRIKADAPEQKLREIVEQSRARSAVFDVLSNGTKVDIEVEAA